MSVTDFNRATATCLLVLALAVLPFIAKAQEIASPGEARAHPAQVYWGDLHVHTYLSGDAFVLGTRLTPDTAYRFAKGEAVQATGGMEVRLRRPLDFVLIADHAENLGVIPRLAAGDDRIPESGVKARFARTLAELPPLRDILNAETLEEFREGVHASSQAKAAWSTDYGVDEAFKRSIWGDVVAVAERHNNPGVFTAFAGFEWSGRAPGMIHRNVLFSGGPDLTREIVPYSKYDSNNVEDLWAYMEAYENRFGGEVISIPHNGNLSRGDMFSLSTFDGEPLSAAYAQARSRWEPIYEVTQIKGDGETHPLLSPADEFADYETWPPKNVDLTGKGGKDASKGAKGSVKGGKGDAKAAKGDGKGKEIGKEDPSPEPGMSERSSYARSALMLGLDEESRLAANPFKFGMIGSTDSHTGLATADEDRFWGKMGLGEPSRFRATEHWYYTASGYAAVWAEENTREALFAAMKRRETYATTGPRMTVRFFGGWDYEAADAARADLAQVGYAKGVPMGGDLRRAPGGKPPRFLIAAMKDPDGANLDRIQIIKGWRDSGGTLHERVYNAALSDGRVEDERGMAEPVGNTVDVAEATYDNSIGGVELAVLWKDPEFDPGQPAFYYVRVLEIPTPRWTAHDAKYFGLNDLPESLPMLTQEGHTLRPSGTRPDIVDADPSYFLGNLQVEVLI